MQNDPLHDRPLQPESLPETNSALTPDPLPLEERSPEPRSKVVPLGLVLAISAVVLVAGSATAWWTWTTTRAKAPVPAPTALSQDEPQPLTEPTPADSPSAVAQPTTKPSADASAVVEQTVQVYWLKDTGNHLELAPTAIALETPPQADATLKAAFKQLLDGPTEASVASTIPKETQLRSLDVRQDGIHVDLSKEFTSGGGSASMAGRLAQVIYTATTLDPTAKVWLEVEGKPLDVLGGEGLLVDQPMTRTIFAQNFPL